MSDYIMIDGVSRYWPMCIIKGCANRSCLRLNSPRCYPHTLPGVPLPTDEVREFAHATAAKQP